MQGNNPMHYAALAESPEVASFLMQETRGLLGPGLPLLALLNADGTLCRMDFLSDAYSWPEGWSTPAIESHRWKAAFGGRGTQPSNNQ